MECGESLEAAAARETFEETGIELNVDDLRFYAIASLQDINQVYVGFRIRLETKQIPVCGSECREVGFFAEDDVPWGELAYPDIAIYLRRFFEEMGRHEDFIHYGRLEAQSALRTIFQITETQRKCLIRKMSDEESSD